MTQSTVSLPFLGDRVFVTDGGLETTLIFLEGIDLPQLAAFTLLGHDVGHRALRDYFTGYAEMGRQCGVGVVLDSPTRRASADWGKLLGYDEARLDEANKQAVALLLDVRARHATAASPIVVSGAIGPRGDGCVAGGMMTPGESAAYHHRQVCQLAAAGVDVVTALTMTYSAEAIGIANAAAAVGVPCAISFTVEVDGRLPDSESLGNAIRSVDAATGASVTYFMINCAHPTHFAQILNSNEDWVERIRGIRSNASKASHAELDEAETLDSGDPVDFGDRMAALQERHRHLTLLGGCCGTDERHVEQIVISLRR